MTLATKIAVLAPVPVKELFDWVNATLLKVENPITYDNGQTHFDKAAWEAAGAVQGTQSQFWVPTPGSYRTMGNQLGQGFAAIFDIDYRPDDPLYPTDEYYFHEVEDCDCAREHGWDAFPVAEVPEDHRGGLAHPAMVLQVNFDTAYSYKHETMGFGCGTLHAIYITLIGKWLAERGVSYRWYNEFEGTWNEPGNEQSLGKGGADANAWFENTVKPAILQMAGPDAVVEF